MNDPVNTTTFQIKDLERIDKRDYTLYIITDLDDNDYSTFSKPGLWEQLTRGDTIKLKWQQSGQYKNIVDPDDLDKGEPIKVLKKGELDEEDKQDKETETREKTAQEGHEFRMDVEHLVVKWASKCAAIRLSGVISRKGQEKVSREEIEEEYEKWKRLMLEELGASED